MNPVCFPMNGFLLLRTGSHVVFRLSHTICNVQYARQFKGLIVPGKNKELSKTGDQPGREFIKCYIIIPCFIYKHDKDAMIS